MPNIEQIENYNKIKKSKAEIWFDVKNILLKLMFSLGIACILVLATVLIGLFIIYLIGKFPKIMAIFSVFLISFIIFCVIKDY